MYIIPGSGEFLSHDEINMFLSIENRFDLSDAFVAAAQICLWAFIAYCTCL